MKYWEIKAKADGKIGELLLYGDISNAQYWGDEVTPTQIDTELKALGDIETLNVRINSSGGSVFAGQAICSIIKRHNAKVKNAYIDGLAASIASLIPTACHKVYMPRNALMMIHKPWGSITGNANDMRQRADLMDKVEDTMVDCYVEKSGQTMEKVKEMLSNETWLNAEEALKLGFIDEIEQETQIAASIDGDFFICNGVKVDTTKFVNFEKIKGALIIEPYRGPKEPKPVADKLQNQEKEFLRIKNKLLGGC